MNENTVPNPELDDRTETMRKSLNEIVRILRRENQEQLRIPTSQDIYTTLLKGVCRDEDQAVEMLSILVQARFLFAPNLELRAPGDTSESIGKKGYLVAEMPVLGLLLNEYSTRLEKLYETEFYVRKNSSAIVRELGLFMDKLKNNPLGELYCVVVMLQQYRYAITVSFAKFREEYRQETLNGILYAREMEVAHDDEMEEAPAAHRRAVDTEEYKQIRAMDTKDVWDQAVAKFGVRFLLRIHFRKYEFRMVSGLIRRGKIHEPEDLRWITETMAMMLDNLSRDPELKSHTAAMHGLLGQVQDSMRLTAVTEALPSAIEARRAIT